MVFIRLMAVKDSFFFCEARQFGCLLLFSPLSSLSESTSRTKILTKRYLSVSALRFLFLLLFLLCRKGILNEYFISYRRNKMSNNDEILWAKKAFSSPLTLELFFSISFIFSSFVVAFRHRVLWSFVLSAPSNSPLPKSQHCDSFCFSSFSPCDWYLFIFSNCYELFFSHSVSCDKNSSNFDWFIISFSLALVFGNRFHRRVVSVWEFVGCV